MPGYNDHPMNRATLYALVALGGALGAMARVVVGDFFTRRYGTSWPWGTLVINVSGCFAIGLLVGVISARQLHPGWRYLLPIGFVGAYTTFSTFALETERLVAQGAWNGAAAYVLISNVVGYFAVVCGAGLARLMR